MSERALTCVIDANVALKLFFDQPGSDRADTLFAHLAANGQTRFYVPDFFFAECASAFATYVRLKQHTPADARQEMADLLALGLRSVPTDSLAESALDIALRHVISGYDAFYVALAQKVDAPLVTADEKLVRALAGKRFNAQSLAGFPIPALPLS